MLGEVVKLHISGREDIDNNSQETGDSQILRRGKMSSAWERRDIQISLGAEKCSDSGENARSHIFNYDSVNILFNDNEPNTDDDLNLIYPLARVHDNNPDPHNRTYKLLGIYLDEYLSLNHHVSQICSKLSRALFLINFFPYFFILRSVLRLLLFLILLFFFCQPIFLQNQNPGYVKFWDIRDMALIKC
jgi:hypothetical protein